MSPLIFVRKGDHTTARFLEGFLEGSLKEALLRSVLRSRFARVLFRDRGCLEGGAVLEGV